MAEFNNLINPIIVGFQAIIAGGIVLKSILCLMKLQSGEINTRQATEKIKKNILVGVLAITLPELINVVRTGIFYRSGDASSWATSNVIAGSQILIKSLSTVLIFIEIPIAIILFVWNGYKYMNCPDEEKVTVLKQISLVIGLAAIIVTITASMPAILKIFQ